MVRVLVLGKGGREHAIVKALSFSQRVTEVHCAPGSEGMKKDSFIHNIDLNNLDELKTFVQSKSIDLVVIGPEEWLVKGLTDHLKSWGVKVFGPSQNGAHLEESKVFAKEFMAKAGVPTARFEVVKSVQETLSAAEKFSPPYVFKVDGLAAGKGVSICKNLDELKVAAKNSFETKIFGASGDSALLEEFQPGWELSFLILTNGKEYQALPLAQDHKALLEGGLGPNTGGMGVVTPIKINEELLSNIHNQILKPSVAQLEKESIDYCGVLFVGLMVTEEGPKVIEYNVRFGDPETQTILPLLDGDWGDVFYDISQGVVKPLAWKPQFVSCVVIAAENYPGTPVKGQLISEELNIGSAFSYLLHAGTKKDEKNRWVTNGGRVLNAIGVGASHEESLENAYQLVDRVKWQGAQVRRDIGNGIKKLTN